MRSTPSLDPQPWLRWLCRVVMLRNSFATSMAIALINKGIKVGRYANFRFSLSQQGITPEGFSCWAGALDAMEEAKLVTLVRDAPGDYIVTMHGIDDAQ